MDSVSPFLILDGSCAETLRWLNGRLSKAGLRLLQTFDLYDARTSSIADCPCPHHGTGACDCQMLVVLVYGEAVPPVTLVLHSNDGRTWLSMVNTPVQTAEASIRSAIEKALQVNSPQEGL